MVNVIVVTLATKPSSQEWQRIGEFKQRARELAENSLMQGGYDLSANFSWNAGEPASFTVKKSLPEEPLRSLLLTFRLFWANDEPSNFLRVSNVLKRHIAQAEAIQVIDDLKGQWKQALFSGVMEIRFNGEELTADKIFDLWLNGHYFHSDAEKRLLLERLTKQIGADWVKFFLASAVTQCCKVIFVLDQALQGLTVPNAAS